ncbi:MAG: MaoC family dehydratase N-terminal domain-containing protein [Myxococcaceae bacterium]|nr:MaoC family dehydratase N-terminal domain-containing protein [Myxococcaceae bacterium]
MPTLEPGATFTHERTCDKYRPIYYGAASGDFNPIHIDPEVGAQAGLGGAILQGMCTMAWAVEAVVNAVGDPGALKKVRVRFSRPVAPGDTVTFTGKITGEGEGGGTLVGTLTAKNQRGEDVLKGATFEVAR